MNTILDNHGTPKLDGWYLWWEKGTLYRNDGANACYQLVEQSTFAEASKAASMLLKVHPSDLDCIKVQSADIPIVLPSLYPHVQETSLQGYSTKVG